MALALVLCATRGRRRRRPLTTAEPARSSSCRATTFHCRAEHLSSDESAFVWDTNFGGELDVVDYGAGRAHVRRELPGDSRRRDSPLRSEPGQLHPERIAHRCGRAVSRWPASSITSRGTSAIAPSASPSTGTCSAARVAAIASRPDVRVSMAAWTCAASCQKPFVDYTWEIEGARAQRRADSAVGRRGLRRHAAPCSAWTARRIAGDQTGFRGEGGVRFDGRRGGHGVVPRRGAAHRSLPAASSGPRRG